MTKKKGKRNKRKDNDTFKNINSNGSVRVPFRSAQLVTTDSASVTSKILIQPLKVSDSSISARIQEIGDTFIHWRMLHMKIKGLCNQFSSGTSAPDETQGTGYIGFTNANSSEYNSSALTTVGKMVDLPYFDFGTVHSSIHLNIPPSGLWKSNPLSWYDCSTSGSSNFTSCGTLVLGAINSANISGVRMTLNVVFEGEIEFKDPVDVSLIPLSHLELELQHLQQRIEARKIADLNKSNEYISITQLPISEKKEEDNFVLGTLRGSSRIIKK